MRATVLLLLALAGTVLSACDDTLIDPYANEGRYFTVWGFLDARETRHTVRVIPVTRLGGIIEDENGRGSTIDAEVVSINLETGRETLWDHQLGVLEDSTFAHLYHADFQILEGARYRLEVRRSDGVMAVAETQVPKIVRDDRATIGPVLPDQGSGRSQQVSIDGVPAAVGLNVYYRAEGAAKGLLANVSYEGDGTQTGSGGWEFTIQLDRDMEIVRPILEAKITAEDKTMTLTEMGVRVMMVSDDWVPPGGVFDPEFLVTPGAQSNVENGFGFFGSFNVYAQNWPVTREFSTDFGWAECFGSLCFE